MKKLWLELVWNYPHILIPSLSIIISLLISFI